MELDSFADDTPIELPSSDAPSDTPQAGGAGGAFDTFDTPEMSEAEMQQKMEEMRDNDGKGDEEGKGKEDLKEKTQTEKIEKDANDIDAEKDNKEKEDKPDDEKDDTDGDKSGKEGVSEKDGEDVEGKKLRVKDGDKALEISEGATVKVKVKGKNEFVSISDLKANYSGKTAYDEKFSELTQEKETVEKGRQEYTAEKQMIAGHLTKISDMLDDPEGNPIEALNYLVDMRGGNTVEFNKRVMGYMAGEVAKLSEMDEVEQELYWSKQQNQFLTNRSTAKAEEFQRTETEKDRVSQISQLRESKGVSEEQFVQAHKELAGMGYSKEDMTSEAIVNYAVIKPHFEKAEELCKGFEEDLSTDDMDELISKTAHNLRDNPRISEEEAIIYSAKAMGLEVGTVESDIDELNSKIIEDDKGGDPKKKIAEREDDVPESFDDFYQY